MQWEVTDWCNHRCVHCYNYWRTEGKGKVAVTPEFHSISQRIVNEIIENRVFSVTITGGEPLVIFSEIYPYLEQLRDAGIQININTNLTLITSAIAKKLLDLGIKGVLTSLIADDPIINDELTSVPGSHKRTVRGIQIAMKNGLDVFVNMVVTQKNLDRVFPTAKYVASLGVTSFSATKAATPGNAPDFSQYRLSQEEFHRMIADLIRAQKELGIKIDSLEFYPPCAFPSVEFAKPFSHRNCTAGRTMCTVGYNGEIRPCSHAPMNYGFVNEGLSAVWQQLNPWRTDEMLPEICKDCSLRFTCGGGCRTEAYVMNKSLMAPDPYCTGKPVVVQKQRKMFKHAQSAVFRIDSTIKTRVESFGGILFRISQSWTPVSTAMLAFVKMHRNTTFTLEELSTALGVNTDQALLSLNLLISKGIIVSNGS
jgi:radical SAM protein with 4Fe4S-binding SPASM domain